MKPIKESFTDWENYVFGFGYGTGEQFTLHALKTFLALCPPEKSYDHTELEAALGGPVTWLMINELCRVNILEYGTSPRHAWLTKPGQRLKEFVGAMSLEQLVLLTHHPVDYFVCSPRSCNCGPNGYDKNRICLNPFWTENFPKPDRVRS